MKKSNIATLLVFLLLIPATLYLGTKLSGRSYYLTGTLIIIELMVPFFMAFEGQAPGEGAGADRCDVRFSHSRPGGHSYSQFQSYIRHHYDLRHCFRPGGGLYGGCHCGFRQ